MATRFWTVLPIHVGDMMAHQISHGSENDMTKVEMELKYFERMASLAKMPLKPNTIKQKKPPAPDIECSIQDVGPLAIELVALDSENTQTRLNNMFRTSDCWEEALKMRPLMEQERLRVSCKNVFLRLEISNEAGNRNRRELMRSIQEKLLKRPDNFVGELYDSEEFPNNCQGVTVIRDDNITDGPQISAPSDFENLHPLQIEKIKEKLTKKTYETSNPLDLFAYSIFDGINIYAGIYVDRLVEIDACVNEHLADSRFRRVWVFDLALGKLEKTYHR
ncbi:hypothetical protein [Verminephrobacter eiseniae]|uniref:hypothetical protein n=1 Tax=Verminephrobacter eiseniae TaxID=364317 RepID=UPI002238E312|nr:hypothetical protein [Verminephrobacter eiseniae]